MHLTRMALNPQRRGAKQLLASPQALHAAVLAAFPPDTGRRGGNGGGRVLWRLDQEGHAVTLYVASPGRPDLSHVVEQAGWPTTSTWETREYAPLLDRLAPGQRWMFRLTANPVHSVRQGEGKASKRLGHVTAAQQEEWLLSRVERLGFSVPASQARPGVAVTDRRTLSFRRHERSVTIARATFDGVLQVSDARLLRAAMVDGIGPAKAYGCGLLTLAPLP